MGPEDLARLQTFAIQVQAGGYTWGFVGRQFNRSRDACQQMARLKGFIPRKQRTVAAPRDHDGDDDPFCYRDQSFAFEMAGVAAGLVGRL